MSCAQLVGARDFPPSLSYGLSGPWRTLSCLGVRIDLLRFIPFSYRKLMMNLTGQLINDPPTDAAAALALLASVGPCNGPPVVNRALPYPAAYLREARSAVEIVDAVNFLWLRLGLRDSNRAIWPNVRPEPLLTTSALDALMSVLHPSYSLDDWLLRPPAELFPGGIRPSKNAPRGAPPRYDITQVDIATELEQTDDGYGSVRTSFLSSQRNCGGYAC